MSDIVVVGSMNMDLVVTADKCPQRGETIIGNSFTLTAGGKGANQAVTAAKLGAKVALIAACGNDAYGKELVSNLKNSGVNTENIFCFDDVNTGIASILLEKNKENRIIVVPGANGKLAPFHIEQHRDKIIKAKIVLLQLEIPIETVIKTIEIAYAHQTKVVLDPAPANELPKEIYRKIDFILPNEGEFEQLCTKYKFNSRTEKVNHLLRWGVSGVIITKGKQGITYHSKDEIIEQPAFKVKIEDTTGAGDAFAGGFAYGLHKQWKIKKILEFATCVAGLSVTKRGAQSAIPEIRQVEMSLSRLKNH